MADHTLAGRSGWVVSLLTGVIGIVVGTVIGMTVDSFRNDSLVLHVPVHATASQGAHNSILATGPLESSSMEYVAFLDALTGDLTAAALNPNSAKFQIMYKRNIAEDFGPPKPKNPKFLMVSGQIEFPRLAGRRFGQSAIYVMEMTTGRCMAYGLPEVENRESNAKRTFPALPLQPLDRVEFRKVKVRPGAAEAS